MVPGLRRSSLGEKKEPKVTPNLRSCKPSFLFYRGSFPNNLDSGFHFIVGYLLEAMASMRLGFHFIGVGGEVSVGNNIVNTV